MKNIIKPSQFKQVPWKNGLGFTTELAIDPQGNLNDFLWRISMAVVTQNGQFSDFSNYQRHLVLIEGKGMDLFHDESIVDQLNDPLDIASFDGACKTNAILHDDPILDFNLIYKTDQIESNIETFVHESQVILPSAEKCFVYSHHATLTIKENQKTTLLPPQHLLIVEQPTTSKIMITGKNFIMISLSLIK